MRSIGIAVVVGCALLGSPVVAQSNTIAARVAASTRSSNGLVLDILVGKSLTDALTAARALGSREDPHVSDILASLFSRMAGPQRSRYELLFRTVIEYVFLRPAVSAAKVAANKGELVSLLGDLQSIGDGATKRDLLELTPFLPPSATTKALLDEGAFLERYLKGTGGRFTPERLSEALAYLSACEARPNPVLRQQTIRLIELARDATFVRGARHYLSISE